MPTKTYRFSGCYPFFSFCFWAQITSQKTHNKHHITCNTKKILGMFELSPRCRWLTPGGVLRICGKSRSGKGIFGARWCLDPFFCCWGFNCPSFECNTVWHGIDERTVEIMVVHKLRIHHAAAIMFYVEWWFSCQPGLRVTNFCCCTIVFDHNISLHLYIYIYCFIFFVYIYVNICISKIAFTYYM